MCYLKRYTIKLVILLCIVFLPCDSFVYAENEDCLNYEDDNGKTTIIDESNLINDDSTVLVYSAEDLFKNEGEEDYHNYILMNDIDFFNCNDNIVRFYGTLDGNGYTIKNRNKNQDEFSEDCDAIIYTNYGTIKNLNVECNINYKRELENSDYVNIAGICIYNNGEILNCHTSGSILVETYTLYNNFVNIGGLACYNDGLIKDSGNGIMIEYNKDYFVDTYGNICTGNEFISVAGICTLGAGYGSDDDPSIIGCYNKGDIKILMAGSYDNIAGITNYGNSVIDCLNAGDIYVYPQYSEMTIGEAGIINDGYIIENCINYGEAENGIATNANRRIINSYYLDDVSNAGVMNNSSGAACDIRAITADQFIIQSTFKGFDFENIWVMGNKHPELRRIAVDKVQSASVDVTYHTHIQTYGDSQGTKKNGEMAGTSGEAKRLEEIWVDIPNNPNLGIRYTTHCQTYGWLPWSCNGEKNGTHGEGKRLEAIKIQLVGSDAYKYDVYYRVHAQSYGWLAWAKNGEPSGTAGLGKRLEGIQIVVLPEGSSAPGIDYVDVNASTTKNDLRAYVMGNTTTDIIVPGNIDTPNIMYKTHVQSYGWQNWRVNGESSGTYYESKRLEGINIKLSNCDYDGGIEYRTHIQSYGWEKGFKKNGEMSGTSGESKRLEAIEIRLTGEMSEHYDVYYRVHAQSFGWLAWTKNGAPSGTAGYGKRLEAIQIQLVLKGEDAPTVNPYEYGDSRSYIQN